MTMQEVRKILSILYSTYLIQARKLSWQERQKSLDVWYETFKDFDKQSVEQAVQVYIRRGARFLPSPPDIIDEINRMNEQADSELFEKLIEASRNASHDHTRIVITDSGGWRWSEEYHRNIYYHPEAKQVSLFTESEFNSLPVELKLYSNDIDGLQKIYREYNSDPIKCRQRFMKHLLYLRTTALE